jgi:hypothetical protein
MARAVITVTQSWASVLATSLGTIYVEKIGEGVLLLNDAASDIAALAIRQDDGPRKQVEVKSASGTVYARATGDGWKIITDNSTIMVIL